MDLLYKIFLDPFLQMGTAPDLLVQTLWEGLVAGVLYALIALGYVLIYKASGVFNFAQGIMVVFAALTLVGIAATLRRWGVGPGDVAAYGALVLTALVMLGLAWGVERVMLRPLVNQPEIILFMATFGLTYFLIGFGELLFGGEPKVMITDDLHLPRGAVEFKMLGGFASLQKIDVAAGIVALATGIMWGARSDVSFALQTLALKALPVLILGGFTSIPGAIVGGVIIGVGEKLGEFYWGPLLGSGIESWLAYVIALVFLLFRPQGLFGEKIIERI